MRNILFLLGAMAVSGCSQSGPVGFLPSTSNVWAVVVDVTPSVEIGNETDARGNLDTGSEAGERVQHELDIAQSLRSDDWKTDYYEISGSMKPDMKVERLPKSTAEVGEQDKPISDYAACVTEVIDRYENLKKDQKVRLTIFGDFRHASGSENYRNWTPTPGAFGNRRIDGWQVDLIYPNYPSGSGTGAEDRAELWKKCLLAMGAASVNCGTSVR